LLVISLWYVCKHIFIRKFLSILPMIIIAKLKKYSTQDYNFFFCESDAQLDFPHKLQMAKIERPLTVTYGTTQPPNSQ